MTIAFVHPHQAFLPELNAYQQFFSRYDINTLVCKPGEADNVQAQVEWHFMGVDVVVRRQPAVIIHEYPSASIQPFRVIKNLSKRLLHRKPHFRLFLNDYVRSSLNFQDRVPFGYRDMGINDSFLRFDDNMKKKYDFVYIGSIGKERKIEKMLECFASGKMEGHSILILSRDYGRVQSQFASRKNIFFKGPVEHENVKSYIAQSRFALNYLPDIAPFNHQTSTKFLEYAALKIPIVSTKCAWLTDFQRRFGGNYFYLESDLSNLAWEPLTRYQYSFPNLDEWSWTSQIKRSGVLEFLSLQFPQLTF